MASREPLRLLGLLVSRLIDPTTHGIGAAAKLDQRILGRAAERKLEVQVATSYLCFKARPMNPTLTAEDLWPLVQKLTHDEQVRLAKLALRAAALSGSSDAESYRVHPPGKDEFSSDEEPLAWETEGWDEFDASR
jgi:hypothetical protein